jgi:hypothetical protein
MTAFLKSCLYINDVKRVLARLRRNLGDAHAFLPKTGDFAPKIARLHPGEAAANRALRPQIEVQ